MSQQAAAKTVTVTGLRVDLDGCGVSVVDSIDFSIDAGEVLGLIGESGSGKTTVGLALLGDARRGARIVGGSVVIEGREVTGLSRESLTALRGSTVAYVPQDPSMALNPALTVGRQIDELFEFHEPDTPAAERTKRTAAILDEVGLSGDAAFRARFPHQLSGGQQQRVTLAMAFVLRPRLIVLDEPTTGLDVTTQARVLATVRDLCATHQVAALYVTHDMAVVAGLAHRVLVMYAGRIVEAGTREEIFERSVHPYTRALIAAVPVVSERRELAAIPGHAPMPGRRPSGCPFRPRCPDAIPACSAEAPEPVEVRPGHLARCIRARTLADRTAIEVPLMAPSTSRVGEGALLTVSHLDAFHGKKQILSDISIDLVSRECLALVGESGCGKTTLARCIIGLHHQHSGGITFRGEALRTRTRDRPVEQRRAMQYIFQSPYNSLNPRRTIGEILREPLKVLFSVHGTQARHAVSEALERVSLPATVAAQYPSQLSGGERQRVAIARALVCRPQVLICDEITSALDVSVQAAIVALLRGLREEERLTLLFVTHNLALVRTIADRVIAMRGGRLVESGDVDDMLDNPSDPYTRELIAASPTMDALCC